MCKATVATSNAVCGMMYDFKKWQYNSAEKQAVMEEAMKAYESTEMQLDQKCVQFEDCLGTLLRKAFMHVLLLAQQTPSTANSKETNCK